MRDVQRLNDKSDEKICRSQRAQKDIRRIVQGRCSHNCVNYWKILNRSYQRENRVQYDNSDVCRSKMFPSIDAVDHKSTVSDSHPSVDLGHAEDLLLRRRVL